MNVTDGGPEFRIDPRDIVGGNHIDLHDWFAGMALQGWIWAMASRRGEPGYDDHAAAVEAVRLSLETADAMLRERDKGAET